jgi:hypothetical protein
MRATFYINFGAAILLRIARVFAKRTRSHDIVTEFANSHMLHPVHSSFKPKPTHHLLYAQTKPTPVASLVPIHTTLTANQIPRPYTSHRSAEAPNLLCTRLPSQGLRWGGYLDSGVNMLSPITPWRWRREQVPLSFRCARRWVKVAWF